MPDSKKKGLKKRKKELSSGFESMNNRYYAEAILDNTYRFLYGESYFDSEAHRRLERNKRH